MTQMSLFCSTGLKRKQLKNKTFSEDFLLCEPCEMADLIDDTVEEMTEGSNGE